MTKYYRYDAYLGSQCEISEKEYNRKIKSRYILPVWDDYFQQFTDTHYDCRDSIVRIFYWSVKDDETD